MPFWIKVINTVGIICFLSACVVFYFFNAKVLTMILMFPGIWCTMFVHRDYTPNPMPKHGARDPQFHYMHPTGNIATGFFGQLTPQQQKDALAYRGEENHGDDKFKNNG